MDARYFWPDADGALDFRTFHPEELVGLTVQSRQDWDEEEDWEDEDEEEDWEDEDEDEEEDEDLEWEEDEDEEFFDEDDEWDA